MRTEQITHAGVPMPDVSRAEPAGEHRAVDIWQIDPCHAAERADLRPRPDASVFQRVDLGHDAHAFDGLKNVVTSTTAGAEWTGVRTIGVHVPNHRVVGK